jgi:hypothetical protein
MGEQNDTARVRRHAQIADQTERRDSDLAPSRTGSGFTVLNPALTQQPDCLFIGELVEIAVERADPLEMLGGMQAHDKVGVPPHIGKNFLRCRGNGEYKPGGTPAFDRDERGFRRGPCGKAIIDDDGGASGRVQARTFAQVSGATAFEFRQFALVGTLKISVVRAGNPLHLFVDHGLRVLAFDDGAERHFWRTRRTDLAHQNEIERGVQGARDFQSHRHPTTRQRIDDGAIKLHRDQPGRQLAACIGPIQELEM